MKTDIVSADFDGVRITRWFKKNFSDIPFALVSKWLRKRCVKVNGKRVSDKYILSVGEEIVFPNYNNSSGDGDGVTLGDKVPPKLEPKQQYVIKREDLFNFKNSIIYEDENIIAVNKPYNLASQAGTGISKSLDRIAVAYDKNAKLLHRLDRHTTGVVLLSKNDRTARLISQALREKQVEKVYWAIVVGRPKLLQGMIDIPLIKGENSKREKMIADYENGKEAKTGYEVIQSIGVSSINDNSINDNMSAEDENIVHLSWVRLYPQTGRTHQLRVHMNEIGHPILGDYKYGGDQAMPLGVREKMHLHAFSIDLSGVYDKAELITAKLPEHIKESFDKIGFDINIVKE